MIPNSDLEKWQKAIQGIETGQKDLSPEELSAFHALKELAGNGNFESNESGGYIKVIKDALPKHGIHRLLQVHLKNFVALCEQYFRTNTQRTNTSAQPTRTATQNTNTDKKESNKTLIIIVAALVVGFLAYNNWDTVKEMFWKKTEEMEDVEYTNNFLEVSIPDGSQYSVYIDSVSFMGYDYTAGSMVAYNAGNFTIKLPTVPKERLRPVALEESFVCSDPNVLFDGLAIGAYKNGNRVGEIIFSDAIGSKRMMLLYVDRPCEFSFRGLNTSCLLKKGWNKIYLKGSQGIGLTEITTTPPSGLEWRVEFRNIPMETTVAPAVDTPEVVLPPTPQTSTDTYSNTNNLSSALSSRLLTDNDLRGLSKKELRILRNEIYARHGYIFKSQDLRDYFSAQSWYQPRSRDVSHLLNQIEKQNVAFIQRYE